MKFTQCYAGGSVSAPSLGALLTGLHTGHSTIRGNGALLTAEDFTVADLLARSHYKTTGVGKWPLGDTGTSGAPLQRGFRSWAGFVDSSQTYNAYPSKLWHGDIDQGLNQEVAMFGNQGGGRTVFISDMFSKAATNVIRVHTPTPFFLLFNSPLPHANFALGTKPGNGFDVPSDAPYTVEKWPPAEKNRAAMITRLDAMVGGMLDYLKQRKLDTNTIIIFTSDNGPHQAGGVKTDFFKSAGPFRGRLPELTEGGLRVPMIVRWTGRIRPGTASDFPWAFWDFLPTVADLSGVKLTNKVDGISIVPTLLGYKQTNQHEYLYWESHALGSQQAVRAGDWKAIRSAPSAALELYNLKQDLRETNNVATANPEVVKRMEVYLKDARKEDAHWPLNPAAKRNPEDKVDPEETAD